MKFKVGDRVKSVGKNDPSFGYEGVIAKVRYDGCSYTVKFDNFKEGHSGDIEPDSRSYYFVEEKNLELVSDSKFTPPFYVDCPTEEIWNKVEQKMFDMGYYWAGTRCSRSPSGYFKYGKEMAISDKDKDLRVNNIEPDHFKKIGYKHISHQDFLGEDVEETATDKLTFEDMQRAFEAINQAPSPLFYIPKINNSFKEKTMSVLNTLSARLKRTLNPNLRAFYQLGWIDGDLEVTSEGREALVDFLFDNNEDELGKVAIKKIKDLKKKEKDEE